MLIVILFCLLTESTVEGQTSHGEQFRVERLQGQCSAWCYETYGSWAPAQQSGVQSTEERNVYQCRPGLDEDCWDCDIGCSLEFNNRARCYQRCNNKVRCKEACRHHEAISRQQIDMEQYQKNITFTFPHDIYEESDKRNHSSVSLWWNHMDLFSERSSIVYMIFLLNYTSDTSDTSNKEDKEDPEGLYIGHTPHYVFPATPLSPDYCYRIKMLTVSNRNGVVGTGLSNNLFATDALIHVTNINTTSADIWFKMRHCESNIDYTIRLVWDDNNFLDMTEYSSQEDDIFTAHAPGLLPNKEYRVVVERHRSNGEISLFSFYGKFTTLPAVPDTTVIITNAIISDAKIAYNYVVADVDKLYATENEIQNYRLKIKAEDEEEWEEIVISNSVSSGLYNVPNLTPYVKYCVSMAVSNPTGVGPFSEERCDRTSSAVASAPELKMVSTSAHQAVIEVTHPDPPKGKLVTYNVTFMDDTSHYKKQDFAIEEGPKQNITIRDLNSHTTYTFIVSAINAEGMVGSPKEIEITTLESVPESAPQLSTCDLTSTNSTHFNATVSWVGVHEDEINGVIENYTLHLQKVITHRGVQTVEYNNTYSFSFALNDTIESFVQPLDGDFVLEHSKNELVRARLSISTEKGQGPWPTEFFNCTVVNPGSMGPVALEIVLPVLGVVAVFIFVVGAFFYFFRFKTYKKTPYEEIKKLIRPETFSPCQHCMHNKEPKRWDVFICHVSEDENYIIQLKEAFVREKIDVFFAKDELSWGCELHRVINDGLRDSKYGLVVLSKHFVNKCSKWTSSELSSLHSKSRLSPQDCILPIWKKDISEAEVGAFDMTLVGIKALKEEDMSVDQMAVELKKKLRNDGCWGCSMRKLNNQSSGGSTPKSEDVPLIGLPPNAPSDDEEGTSV